MSEEEKRKQGEERGARQQQIMDKMKAKQTVVPAPPPQSTVQQEDAAKCRAHIEAAGWTLSGLDGKGNPMFADPLGTGDRSGKFVEAKELPNRDGEPTIIKQMVVPPTSWSLPLGEAFMVQQARDAAARKVA